MRVTRFQRQFRELDDLVLHLKGLVLVRELLQERGATPAEIRRHSEEIERLRDRVAQTIGDTGGGAYGAAA